MTSYLNINQFNVIYTNFILHKIFDLLYLQNLNRLSERTKQ